MFEPNDRVAWSHAIAPFHDSGSILRPSALPEGTPIGLIVEAANEKKTWWEVKFNDDVCVLTEDELVKVGDEN